MLHIALLPEEYAVCQLPAGSPVATGLLSGPAHPGMVSITWTAEHVSVICPVDRLPEGTPVETPWRCIRVLEPLHQAATGTLATLVNPLAAARVTVVAFSAYDTDYLLVPTVRLAEALATLARAGHRIDR
jgi:hypothetical protein